MNKRPANTRLMQAVRMICGRRSGLSAPAVALLGFSMVSVALAGPTGGVVVDGQATISTPSAGTTVIDQASQHVQLNWNTFDVGANESVRFQQPNSSSVALNRILDQNPSQIFGRIDANGQVVLVNPNGMLFGASAQLNVGSLVASSLDVIGFDAATGRYTFGTSRTDVGAIANEGAITAANGGSVTLLGGRVTNTGSIIADFGTVNLAAGRAATLDLAGDGLLRLEVDGELLTNNSGAGAAVENAGVIQANGGQVLLTARAVDDVFANLVNNTGVVRAARIDNSGGTIRLIGAGGTVRSSGVLDASAGDDVSSGGRVEMLGEQVGLFGAARVDVTGATDGGTALIGGDYQGKNPGVMNAARTYVSSDASILADAGLHGDGGRVIVWADEITRFGGSISARGGALSGNGGFAEVSGKETLLFRGSANLSAANGFAGELLLDPRNIIIATGGEGDLAGDTGDDGAANDYAFAEDAADDITIAPSTITDILDTGTTVTLQAHNDITVTDAIDGSASTTPGGGLIFQAGDDIFINADVRTNDGVIEFTAGDDAATPTGANGDDAPRGELRLASGVTLSAGNAAVTLNSDGSMQLLGTVSGNAITAASGGALTVGTLNAGAGAVNLTATGSVLDDGDNTTRITGGALTMNAGSAIGALGATGQIDTDVTSLTASASNGGIHIGELNGLTLTNVSSAGATNRVNVTSTTGDIVVGTVSATNEVILVTSAGSILDDDDNTTRITTQTLTMGASAGVGTATATGQIDTSVNSLGVNSSGSVYIGESDDITLTSVTAAGAGSDLVVTSSTGNIVARAVGATDTVTLTATTGSIVDDGIDTTRIYAGSTLTLSGTAIGASTANGQIDTDVTELIATASNGGVYIGELNGLTLNNVSALGAGNNVHVTSESGDIVVGSVTAADSVTMSATVGSITDDTFSSTRIRAQTATLTAGTAIGSSAADEQIDTDVTSLSATASAGGVYIGELNGLTLTNITAAGAGNDVYVYNTSGEMIVGTVNAADAVTLTTGSGTIVDDGDNTTRISGRALSLSAYTIGATGATGQIDTDVTSLTASTSVGSMYIGELNGLTLTSATTFAAGSDIVVTSATGDIVVGNVTATNSVTLTATTGAITNDNSDATRISAGVLNLSAGTSIGAAGANGAIDTAVTSLSAEADAGGVYISEADGVTLSDVNATGAGGDVNVRSSTGDIVVNTVTAADQVTLTATAGSIVDDGDNATRISASALTLNANAAIGAAGATDQIDTDVNSLVASASGGSIYIGEANGITLTNLSAAGAGSDVHVTNTTGDITVGAISATDEVTLAASAGYIRDDANNATRIAAATATLTGTGIGAAGANGQIDTDVAALTANTTAGSIYVGESNGLTLTDVNAVGTGNDVVVTSTTGNIVANSVTAAGTVSLTASAGNVVVSNITSSNSTLTATTGSILDDGDNSTRISVTGSLVLDAGAGIGATGATGQIDTDAASLTARADAGSIYIGELNGLTLTDVSAAGAGSDVIVTSTTGNIVATSVTAADTVSLTAAGGDIEVSNITATNAAMLTAATGSIVDDGDNSTRIVVTGNLTLNANGAIGAAGSTGQVDTNVNSLSATAGNGGVYIGEANGLTLTNVSAGGAGGDVVVTSTTGNIVANDVSAQDTVSLSAAAGNVVVGNISASGAVTLSGSALVDDDDDTTVISGGNVSLSATSNIGTVVDFDAANDADVGSSLDVQTNGALTATVTNADGQINLNLSGAPTLSTGAITLGSGSNRAGAIVLQSAGDLNVSGLAPGAINVGSNNTTQLGLRSGGVLTVPASIGFTDQPVDHLLVRGATDVVDNDANPRELSFSAGTLDFRSGAAGGATILNTTVARLSASLENDYDLTVNETDGVALGTLDVGNGNITFTAGGAVTDDGDNATRIVSNSAALSGASLGDAGNALDTQVNTLTASATSGGVYVSEVDGLAVTVNATGGAADVRTTNGSLTVASATGTGVTLIAGGAGNDITLNGAVNAGAGDVTLTAGTVASRGAIVSGAGAHITGNTLIANASTVGTSTARLNTTVAAVNATSTNGGIFISESDALTLTANASGGAVDVATANGALTVTQATGDGVTLAAGGAGNGIAINGAVDAGAGNVLLDAGTPASRGAIVAGAGNQITGNLLVMSGSSIGAGAARLNTNVNALNATSTNGGIFITEANALNVTANATNGMTDVRTTNGALNVDVATGDGVTLVAGGAGNGITLNGAVNAGAGDVTLTAGTPANGGAIIQGAGHQITGGTLTATGSMIGSVAARLNTNVASLNATSSNGGIYVIEADALNLNASAIGGPLDVQTNNGSLTVAAASGNGVTLTAGGAGSGITLNGPVNAGVGDVTLTAGTVASRGAIVGGVGNHIAGNSLTMTGATIGASGARLNTNVDAINASTTGGGIFITEADAVNLAANASGGALDVATVNGALTVAQATGNGVTLTAGGAGNGITLNAAVDAGAGDVTLTAGTAESGGAIVADAGVRITGNSLTMTGGTIGASGARLNTTVASINATSTNGGIFIAETDALNLTANAIGGAVDVQTGNGSLTVAAANGDGVTLTAGGAGSGITLNGSVNGRAGDVTLTAGTAASRGAISGTAGHLVSGRTLTVAATTIGASNARLNTNIDALNAVASTGDVYISEQNGLTLVNVSAARDIDVASATGDIVVNTVSASNAVTLTATSGAIADDGDDTTRLVANALTLNARSIGAASTLSGTTLNSSGRLDTEVATLSATTTGGGIFIDEADGLQSVNVQASGGDAGDIELLTRTGDLILNRVSASDRLLLAAGRNIFAAPGAGPVTARAAELRAGTTDPTGGLIGSPTDAIEFQLGAGNSLRLFVPQSIDPDDPSRAPAVSPTAGVNTTLNQFASQSALAALAGFNQFQGLGEIQFTSPAETLVRTLQSQTGTLETGLDIDWGSYDPDVSLFGTLEPSVCLPADQRDEESSTPDC